MIRWCLFCIFLYQNTAAQVISYVPRNVMSSNIATNQPQNIVSNLNNIRTAASLGAPANIPSTIATMSATGVAIPSTVISNGMMMNAQVANAQLANEITENVVHANPKLAALAGNIADFNGNFATFNLGDAFSVTSGSPGNQAFGIKLLADALEVGGTVNVNGHIPIFGTVAIQGNVPTDGAASVNYGCGHRVAVTSTDV